MMKRDGTVALQKRHEQKPADIFDSVVKDADRLQPSSTTAKPPKNTRGSVRVTNNAEG